ncbi:unnamed protein product [Scytosiphon promiscuus]
MMVHQAQQPSIVAAGPALRKSLSRPLLKREMGTMEMGSVFDPSASKANDPPAGAVGAVDKTDQWCLRNSVALLEACSNRDVETAARILEQATVEQVGMERMKTMVLLKDDFRDTALHLSAWQGEVGVVRLLLARGADVNAQNNLGSTPLNRAAVAGQTEVIELLLDAGANLEHQDDISGTPLHGAARRNHCATVRLLLNRGALVDAADGGVANAFVRSAPEHWRFLALSSRVLVQHYANTQIRNMRGQTPMDVAQASWIGQFCKQKIARLLSTGYI